MDYRDRIKIYMEAMDIKPALFVQEMGFSNGLINKVLSKSTHLGGEKLENMLKHFKDLNPAWLLTGTEPMLISSIQQPINVANEPTPIYNTPTSDLKNELLEVMRENRELRKRIEYLEKNPYTELSQAESYK